MKGKNVMAEVHHGQGEVLEDGALYNIKTLMTDIKQKDIQINEYLKQISELKSQIKLFERTVVEEQKARYQSYQRVGHLIDNQSVFVKPFLNWLKGFKFW